MVTLETNHMAHYIFDPDVFCFMYEYMIILLWSLCVQQYKCLNRAY